MLICRMATEASLCLQSMLSPEKIMEIRGLYDLRWEKVVGFL